MNDIRIEIKISPVTCIAGILLLCTAYDLTKKIIKVVNDKKGE